MKTTFNIPSFRRRRQHGQCPACDHVGTDCKCHTHPKKAAAILAKKQIEMGMKHIALARQVIEQFDLKDEALLPNFVLPEIGSIYVDKNDRFILSLVVGYGPSDEVSTPEEAVGAALAFITTDDGSPGTHWHCFDRKTGVLHRIFRKGCGGSQ